MRSIILLTTTTCPKCPEMKAVVMGISGVNVRMADETSSDFAHLCKHYNATQAPTAIVLDEKGVEIFRTDDNAELKKYFK